MTNNKQKVLWASAGRSEVTLDRDVDTRLWARVWHAMRDSAVSIESSRNVVRHMTHVQVWK